MTTFGELKSEVQYHIRQRSDLTSFVESKINEAVLDVMLQVKPPEFFSTTTIATTAGTPNYNLKASDDVLAILSVTFTNTNIASNDRRLRRGHWNEYDEMDQDFSASGPNRGRPRKYFRYANEILFYDDIPDDNDGNEYSIRVRCLERPTEMTSDSDTFPLALEWQEPTVLRAAFKLMTLTGDLDRRGVLLELYNQSISFVLDNLHSIENREDRDASMGAGTHLHRPSSGHASRR